MNIPKELVQEIILKVNIVELIGKYIQLNKNGKNYQAFCPFHNEKTPSFTVYAKSGRFQCFGCGEKGDAITFLMETDSAVTRDIYARMAAERLEISAKAIIRDILRMEGAE